MRLKKQVSRSSAHRELGPPPEALGILCIPRLLLPRWIAQHHPNSRLHSWRSCTCPGVRWETKALASDVSGLHIHTRSSTPSHKQPWKGTNTVQVVAHYPVVFCACALHLSGPRGFLTLQPWRLPRYRAPTLGPPTLCHRAPLSCPGLPPNPTPDQPSPVRYMHSASVRKLVLITVMN